MELLYGMSLELLYSVDSTVQKECGVAGATVRKECGATVRNECGATVRKECGATVRVQ